MNDREVIERTQTEWGQAWSARDAERILSYYDDSAVLFVPGVAPSLGKAVFAPFIRELLKNEHFSLSWVVDDVVVAGDYAFLTGHYLQHNPNQSAPAGFDVETGYYLTVYRRSGNRWLAIREINTPAPAPVQSPVRVKPADRRQRTAP